MPTLRNPPLLRAALATDPTSRRARPSDGHDEAMTRIVSERGLDPAGCQLFKTADVEGLSRAITDALAQA